MKRRCARYINPLLGDEHGLISFDEVGLTAFFLFDSTAISRRCVWLLTLLDASAQVP